MHGGYRYAAWRYLAPWALEANAIFAFATCIVGDMQARDRYLGGAKAG